MSNSVVKGTLGMITSIFIMFGFIALILSGLSAWGRSLFYRAPNVVYISFIIAWVLLGVITMLYKEEKGKRSIQN